jgi:hypothetical protein
MTRRRRRSRPDTVLKVIARWLEEKDVGYVYTLRELRRYVTDKTGVDFIQLDRRHRQLRSYRWVINSNKHDKSLKPNQYQLIKIGDDVNHPECAPQPQGVPKQLRYDLFARDGRQCRHCGIKEGEEYPEYPGRFARMTVAHKLPVSRGGSHSMENCEIQCDVCNEMTQDKYYRRGDEAA